MAEERVALDTLPIEEYRAARDEGLKVSIDPADLKQIIAPPPTGKEELEDYRQKREGQTEHLSKGGAKRRIDQLTREKYELKERVALLEKGNGATPKSEQATPAETQPIKQASSSNDEHPDLPALRQRFPDFDEVMQKARDQRVRISDEAAAEVSGSRYAGQISYLIAKNPQLHAEFNRLPTTQQVSEIKRMEQAIAHTEAGGAAFTALVNSKLDKKEVAALQKNLASNPTAGPALLPLLREITALPNGVDVFRALVKDPSACARIGGMSKEHAVLELGRMSGRIEKETEPENEPERGQRRPIRPVGSGSAGVSSVPLDQSNIDEYRKDYQRRTARDRR